MDRMQTRAHGFLAHFLGWAFGEFTSAYVVFVAEVKNDGKPEPPLREAWWCLSEPVACK